MGKGIVDICENFRVREMCFGEGGCWVGLWIGDEWIWGFLVVGVDGLNFLVRYFLEIELYGYGYNIYVVVVIFNYDFDFFYFNIIVF